MKALWVKKTIYRRYLIEDNELEEVKSILSENNANCIDIIYDFYDKNNEIEYDEEETIFPIDYSIGQA